MNTPQRKPAPADYPPPVSKLLTYGMAQLPLVDHWPNYLELGLTADHIPELIRMAKDEQLYWSESEDFEACAPIHAWRALGQLKATEAIEPLLAMYDEKEDWEWFLEEFPRVFGLIGEDAILPLAQYMRDAEHELFARISAAQSLAEIGTLHPACRDRCVKLLTDQLQKYRENYEELNAFLISFLVVLQAVESLPVIQAAFGGHCVDLHIMGDCEDVEIALGVREGRSTPPPKLSYGFADTSTLLGSATPIRREGQKVGRNDPCPCGSGKKYKRCCGI